MLLAELNPFVLGVQLSAQGSGGETAKGGMEGERGRGKEGVKAGVKAGGMEGGRLGGSGGGNTRNPNRARNTHP